MQFAYVTGLLKLQIMSIETRAMSRCGFYELHDNNFGL